MRELYYMKKKVGLCDPFLHYDLNRINNKAIALMVGLLLLLPVFALAIDETEPNNSTATANAISFAQTGSGIISSTDDVDYWVVNTTADGKIRVDFTSLNGKYLRVMLLSSDESVELANHYTTTTNFIQRDGLAVGTYYIKVVKFSDTNLASYTITPSFIAIDQANDNEPNNNFGQAQNFPVNTTTTGHIGYRQFNTTPVDFDDWYKVTTTIDGRLDVKIVSENEEYINVYLYDGDGTTQLAGNYTTTNHTIQKDGLAPGTYYIKVNNYSAARFAPYTLTNTLVPPPHPSEGSGNDTFATAMPFTLNSSINGLIGYRYNSAIDFQDWFSVTTNVDGKLNVDITSLTGEYIRVNLYDGNGTSLLAGDYTTSTKTIVRDGLAPGEYFIQVTNYSNERFAPYTLTNTLILPPNSSEGNDNDTQETAMEFALNSTIDGHIGYRYNGEIDLEDWYSVTTNVDGELNATITSLTEEYIRVNLYDGNGTSLLAGHYTTGTLTIGRDGLAPGEYFIQVTNYSNERYAPYTLTNTLILPVNSSEGNGNDLKETAMEFALNSTINGHIGYQYNGISDLADWYSVTTDEDGKLSISISSLNGQYMTVKLFDGDGTTQLDSNFTTTDLTIKKDGLAVGEYFVKVEKYTTFFGPYTLTNNLLVPTQPNDMNNLENDEVAGALDLALNMPAYGHIGYKYMDYKDNGDWYKIVLPTQQDLKINFKVYNGNYVNLKLYDSSGTNLLQSNYTTSTLTFNRTNQAAGTYYIKVEAYAGQYFAPYRLSTGIDTDDDGYADVIDCAPEDPTKWFSGLLYVDADGDGYHGSSEVVCYGDEIPEGYVKETLGFDCDDENADINPGAEEVCDGVDNNCDGNIDEGVTTTYYQDADGDGYGNPNVSIEACEQPEGYVLDNTDCDDTNAGINPGAEEIPGNGIDENCDGTDGEIVDLDSDGDGIPDSQDNCPFTYNPDQADLDGDGVGDACDPDIDGDGVLNEDDCDPYDPEVTYGEMYYADADGDGYGDPENGIMACEQPEGYVLDNTDCDDTNAGINPGAEEIPGNGIDENCDGTDGEIVDLDSDGDGIPDSEDNCPNTYNPDQHDGNGNGVGDACEACDIPTGIVVNRTSNTTANVLADNWFWHYQGSANRAGRPLRPYPMYGMTDMSIEGGIAYEQSALVPQFDYSIWLRTICPEGGYSTWVGPVNLPTYAVAAKNMEISVVPNPTKDFIRFEKINVQRIAVYDMYGKLLLQQKVNNNQADLRQLQTGSYLINVWDENDNMFQAHVIKK